MGVYPYDDFYFAQGFDLEEWHTSLRLSRRILLPQDLVMLIGYSAWDGTSLVENSIHMQTEGMFGNEVESRAFSTRVRSQMVEDLRQNPGFLSINARINLSGRELVKLPGRLEEAEEHGGVGVWVRANSARKCCVARPVFEL